MNDMEDVVVIAATNREDLLDAALVRPGRFDMKIPIELPEPEISYKIYLHYLNKLGYDKENITDEDLKQLSNLSEGFSGANIEHIVNEAARLSYSRKSKVILKNDLETTFKKCLVEHKKFQKYDEKNSRIY